MASDIWSRTILIVRKETRCRHIGYSYRLTARVLLYAPSHRQDNTYHSLCYTSRGALAGTRNSSMGPPHEGSIRRPIAPWANALTTKLHLVSPYAACQQPVDTHRIAYAETQIKWLKKQNNNYCMINRMKKIDRNNVPKWLINLPGNCQNREWHPTYVQLIGARANYGMCFGVLIIFQGRKEMFYLTMHSIHFIYGYMASDIW